MTWLVGVVGVARVVVVEWSWWSGCVCGRCELRFNGCGYWWGVRSWGWGCCSYLWFGILEATMAVWTGALIDLNMYK